MADEHSKLSGPPEVLREVLDDPSHALRVLPKAQTAGGLFVDLLADADGTLHVASSGGGAVSLASEHREDTAHVDNDFGIQMLAVRHDAVGALSTDGNYTPLTTDNRGALKVSLGGTGVVISGAVGLASDKVEDVAHASGDTGVFILAVRNSAASTLTDTDGDYSPIGVDGRGQVQIVAAALPLPTGAATQATLATLDGKVAACNTGAVTISAALPAGTNAIGKLAANSGVDIGDVDVTSLPKSATATLANVAGSAASVTLLAANAARMGATFFNDSSSACYLKLGTAASATSFTVKLLGGSYYEMPFAHTGRVDGIWDAASGNMRVTELTA